MTRAPNQQRRQPHAARRADDARIPRKNGEPSDTCRPNLTAQWAIRRKPDR